jgi:glycine/D-amino acid oxidase-like deaminating enzyme
MHVLVVGGGIFGVTAARALVGRGLAVTLVDPAQPERPHPLAESTDISKIVRIDYGCDEDYTHLGEAALDRWRTWEAAHLFHETGVAFLSRGPLAGFERDSYELLTRRGHPLERLDATQIARRFPAYRPGALVDGYFNPRGGWAEASAVVATLARPLTIRTAAVARIVDEGALLADDTLLPADLVIVCAGSWVPLLLPELAPSLRSTGQPVFHLRPADPAPFAAHHFPVFGADISRTGFYGFPATAGGIVKIANHGTGTPLAPGGDAGRAVSPAQDAALREMLADTFPALATAPIVHRRLCVYCDTADGDFWIARHPSRPNLVVATGGSGHAFKFAPVLGDLITDIALGIAHPLTPKFAWRGPTSSGTKEAARHTAST